MHEISTIRLITNGKDQNYKNIRTLIHETALLFLPYMSLLWIHKVDCVFIWGTIKVRTKK